MTFNPCCFANFRQASLEAIPPSGSSGSTSSQSRAAPGRPAARERSGKDEKILNGKMKKLTESRLEGDWHTA